MESKALILVDFQKEWADSSSDYFVWELDSVIEKTNTLINYCRKNDYKIIFTQHIEKNSESAFAPWSTNIEIIDALYYTPDDVVVKKYKISPFFQTTLENELTWIDSIVICGILTNLCVRSLAEGAYDRDYNITIISDCCKAFDEETHDFTLKDIKNTREEIEIETVREFITRL